jgi:hypothetical protein
MSHLLEVVCLHVRVCDFNSIGTSVAVQLEITSRTFKRQRNIRRLLTTLFLAIDPPRHEPDREHEQHKKPHEILLGSKNI